MVAKAETQARSLKIDRKNVRRSLIVSPRNPFDEFRPPFPTISIHTRVRVLAFVVGAYVDSCSDQIRRDRTLTRTVTYGLNRRGRSAWWRGGRGRGVWFNVIDWNIAVLRLRTMIQRRYYFSRHLRICYKVFRLCCSSVRFKRSV